MTKLFAWILPLFAGNAAFATEVKDAPMPTEMNWVAIIVFAVIFFGLTIGFVVLVWIKSRGKQPDDKPDA